MFYILGTSINIHILKHKTFLFICNLTKTQIYHLRRNYVPIIIMNETLQFYAFLIIHFYSCSEVKTSWSKQIFKI